MEAVLTSETSVYFKETTPRRITEGFSRGICSYWAVSYIHILHFVITEFRCNIKENSARF
jgi:hypothetical protein